jgi:hypothetical protein
MAENLSAAVVTKSANCSTGPPTKKRIIEPTGQSQVYNCTVDLPCIIAHTHPYTWHDVTPNHYCGEPIEMTFQLLDVRTYSTVIESWMPDNKINFTIFPTRADYILDTRIPFRLDVQTFVDSYAYDWNK